MPLCVARGLCVCVATDALHLTRCVGVWCGVVWCGVAWHRSERGTLVTYGNVSSKPQYLSLESLVLKDITIRGFSLQR